ncbi:DNA and RNA helicase [Paenibacillus kribbensis]|uniref:DNA and RNA helicase n=1 Tax=Paenibacillus kribbensis TaxID=172713 RepID=UPI002DC006EB|nr:DNA and RNA helicase [Paenibacillus kribbensis]MEC0235056.1 DNA and RNA helicase [Paenibacillus kribbensis]
MLTHIVPKFEKGRILKTEMLENLRDYPRSFLDIRYQDYSDGIITGMNVTVGEHTLTVGRGIVKHKGRLYLLEQEEEVPYTATGRLSVLKIRFQEEQSTADFQRYLGNICLEEEQVNSQELELGRFKLKTGALLRSDYVDFADLATEFNTFNLVQVQHAGTTGPTLSPYIFKMFARELISRGTSDPFDLAFTMLCLNQGFIEREAVLHYLSSRSGVAYRDYDSSKLHQVLARVLEEKGGRRVNAGTARSGGQRMLVD